MLSSEPGAVSPPKVIIGSSTVIVVLFTVVVVPSTFKAPPMTTFPDISTLLLISTVVVAICTSVSAAISSCPSAEELINISESLNIICLSVPTFTVSSITTTSRFVIPSISILPLISRVAAASSPVIVRFLPPVKSLSESTTRAFDAVTVPAVIPSNKVSSVEVTSLTATLPDPSDTKALLAVKLPVVIVLTAPAILATRLVSTLSALPSSSIFSTDIAPAATCLS